VSADTVQSKLVSESVESLANDDEALEKWRELLQKFEIDKSGSIKLIEFTKTLEEFISKSIQETK
jgi:Ca2+-binding EF-hand superfamily protein